MPEPQPMPQTPMVQPNGGSRPIPDPTLLTTAAVEKGLAQMREIVASSIALVQSELGGQKSLFDARLDAMDKAVKLLQNIADKMDNIIDGKITNLERLHDVKFDSIQTQFSERDTRAEQTSKDSKVAVDAALQAAKEAVGKQNEASDRAIQKSEISTTKQIDEQGRRIDDLKERIGQIEGEGRGTDAARTIQQTSNAGNISVISVIIAALGLLGGLVAFLVSK